MPADYEVPIRGRSMGRGADAPAMFASEERELRQERRQRPLEAEARPAAETRVAPEFDREVAMERAADATDAQYEVEADSDTAPEDEFRAELAARAEDGANTEDDFAEEEEEHRGRDQELVPVAASVFDDDFFRRYPAPAGEQATAGVAMASPSQTEGSETDELDIPAFLRRSH